MSDEYINKYVMEIESGHPGFKSFTVISTRDDLKAMIKSLESALEQTAPESSQTAAAAQSPRHVWSTYATIAHGETERVYLNFAVASDLLRYHSKKRGLGPVMGYVLVAAIFVLLAIGLFTTMHYITKLLWIGSPPVH
ncbi:MAG TPA: hypothetical protein VMF06_23515 [Candidatus Limnocylindria bacterium]|jgi:hypothetical protein|nr:hypothetical protein [Candidatus Limnocylindria bacterium]